MTKREFGLHIVTFPSCQAIIRLHQHTVFKYASQLCLLLFKLQWLFITPQAPGDKAFVTGLPG